ncbi:MAG: PEP-CTERM sorting domain-containing protein [Armatimonadetes bacterium]|nr:PEP-CTERM sorting domain-containing protein [Armatimonadota bacterium]
MRSIFVVSILVLSSAAFAQPAFWSGDTTGQATWDRPLSFTGISSLGPVHFEIQPFWVTVGSEYVFEVNGTGHPDTYIHVYEGTFNPLDQLVNLIAGDDDFSDTFTVLSGTGQGFASSRIALGEGSNYGGAGTGLNLTAGSQYFAIVSGFGAGDFGPYDAGIGGGQGQVNLGIVPEPATLTVLGLGALALLRRRRRKTSA